MRGVAGLAAHGDAEAIGRRQGVAANETEGANGQLRAVVQRQRHVDLRIVHDAGCNHLLHAANGLFGRLEDELHGAGKLRRQVLQHGADADQGGGVDVMAASMHLAGHGAGEGLAGHLVDRQRVHVGADREHGARAAAFDQADDTGAGDAGLVLDAEALELAGDDAGGADLLEGELGVGVEVAADLDEAGLDALRGVADHGAGVVGKGHGSASGAGRGVRVQVQWIQGGAGIRGGGASGGCGAAPRPR